jgi:hypothetical protein
MKPYSTADFPGYSDYFRQYSIALVELMRILKEVIEAEGMEVPSTKHLYNMVTNSLYEIDNVVKTVQTEIQSLKTNDNSN